MKTLVYWEWEEYDARGIYLTRVCDDCIEAKLYPSATKGNR
jgi:hypothetical protein